MSQEYKINRKDTVTSRLGFKPNPKFNNFCIGKLDNVELVETESDKNKRWEYAGETFKSIRFSFIQTKFSKDEPDRFFTHSELPITGTNSKGEPLDTSVVWDRFVEMWKRIKHLHDQYRNEKGFREFPSDPVFRPDGTTKQRLADMDKFFTMVNNVFNGEDGNSPFYKNVDLVIKLVAIERVYNGKRFKVLDIPYFIGKGCYDRFKVDNNGKLNTVLEFKSNEVVDLSISPITPTSSGMNPNGAGESDLPDEIKAQLGLK